jgi:hypothetical protein
VCLKKNSSPAQVKKKSVSIRTPCVLKASFHRKFSPPNSVLGLKPMVLACSLKVTVSFSDHTR